MKPYFLAVLLVASVVAVSGCASYTANGPGGTGGAPAGGTEGGAAGGGSVDAGGTGGDSQRPVAVSIQGFAFSPQTVRVGTGTTVTWTNMDDAAHTATSDPHPVHTALPGLSSGTLEAGESYSFTFTESGTWTYHCHLHPNMRGTVVVE